MSISRYVIGMPDKKDRFCRSCGKAIEGNEKFCRSCGTPVVREESVVQKPVGSISLNEIFDMSSVGPDFEWDYGLRALIVGGFFIIFALLLIFINLAISSLFGAIGGLGLVVAFGMFANDYERRKNEISLVLCIVIAGIAVILNLGNLPFLVFWLVLMAISYFVVKWYAKGKRGG